MTRAYHHGNLRASLLDRAEEVLADDGVDGLSLRALARDLGVSHGAPARHFRDRQALLDALALRGFERLDAALATTGGTWQERLRGLARTYVDFATAHPALLAAMYDVKHHPDATEALRAEAGRGRTLLRDTLRSGQRAGEVVEGDADELGTVLFAAVHGVVQLAAGDLLDGADVREVLDATVALCLRGLAPPAGSVPALGAVPPGAPSSDAG
ncbi:TetR/AcrR family transcriptional regulator [Isoptericola aurantiacus]|uniref:TetR/AcrR family transcriptional regulator n=1 Tax=Isoptericola aurantiacus TaxID=3377839 RepID=UPI00383BB34D